MTQWWLDPELIPLRRRRRRLRVPLPAAHARDFYRFEQTGFSNRLLGGESFRGLAARHIDDEHTTGPRRAVFGERPSGQHDNVLVAIQVSEMRLARRVADWSGLAGGPVFVDHDVEHVPPVKNHLQTIFSGRTHLSNCSAVT